MKERLKSLLGRMFYRVPPEYALDFKKDSLEKNVRRFSILPFFNIFTQVSCIFIYLYVYPTVYPERKQIDARTYLIYTVVYIAVNLVAAALFIWLRRRGRLDRRMAFASVCTYVYILCYVVLESSQVAIELEISGNIYRFLATFFVVSFFPVVGRLARAAYMTTYILISELALRYLQSIGVNVYSYVEINLVVFVVCLVASNIYYNGTVRNFELRKRLEFLSMNDELTGLANRRSLNSYLEQSWKTAIRSGGTMGVLMIDIDHFKRYNDTYGHQAGDACLAAVAKAICGCFDRATDLCARYGGEEFAVVISHIPPQGVPLMAERVRAAVEALAIPHSGNAGGVVTCSVGATVEAPTVGGTSEALMRHADDALYAAKTAGRNRVAMYEAEAAPG